MARGKLKNGREKTEGNVWHSVKTFKNTDKIRREAGLPLVKSKQRECLRCEKEFTSYAFQHRLCDSCNEYAKRTAPDRGEVLRTNS